MLEGPTVVTDSAQFPKQFQESPQLTELVKQGKLPSVAERIGQDPLVIKPVHEIGIYGGTWRRAFIGPGDLRNGLRAASGTDSVLFWDFTGEKVVPNIARGFEAKDDGRTLEVQLRRGMKWSDGQPFTADDFVFWFEDMYQNADLIPTPSSTMMINSKPGRIEKGDDYLVRFVFPDPYYLLPDVLAGVTPIASHSLNGQLGMGCYAPAHYLKQYLPKYAGQAVVDKLASDAGFNSWVTLLKFKNDWSRNPELPCVTPWKTIAGQTITDQTWAFERNPYSIWVDTAGNQLPYLDKITMALAENTEVVNLRAIAGEYDNQSRHIDIAKLPVLLENQDRGGYKIHLDPGDWGSDMIIKFNFGYDADPEIRRWFNTTEFRRALSLGIDRDQFNETFWLGLGTPGSVVPADTNKYNPGPEYRKRWATFDPKQANALLDQIGLDKKDGDGLRLRSDGKGPLRLELYTTGGILNFPVLVEMLREQWRRIGIDILIQNLERTLMDKRAAANQTQLYVWLNDGSEHMFTFPESLFPYNAGTAYDGIEYARWFQSNGAQGKEPPAKIRDIMDKFKRAFGVPQDQRIALGKDIWATIADECMVIGTVGLSPAAAGVRVVKTGMGNVPEREFNCPDAQSPATSRTMTFFWKQSA